MSPALDPVAEFRALAARHERCFWLDGGGARRWSGRRSILGGLDEDDVSLTYDAARREVTRHARGTSDVVGDDIFAVLERAVAEDSPDARWIGYFGYACRPDLPALLDPTGAKGMPDAVWMRTRHVRVIEHTPPAAPAPYLPAAQGRLIGTASAPADYAAAFAEVQHQLRSGNSYEVNLTHRLTVTSALDPVEAYLQLRTVNPAPYAGFLQHHGCRLLSSSPERFATIDRNRVVETRPIKGTAPRGRTTAEDARLGRVLAEDPKTRAENLMIVDLLRNDLSHVSEPGTVEVPVLMEVESYPSVHQLVSTVRGRLRPGISTVRALRELFPAGSMTGAPKLRTMEIIRDVESTPRGVYSGAFGWISGDGRADLGVVIRSLTTTGDGTWQIGTGGGVTVRSRLDDEYAECGWKAERMLGVLREGGADRSRHPTPCGLGAPPGGVGRLLCACGR